MEDFTVEQLKEARRAIDSLLSKLEKTREKLRQGTSQWTLLIRRVEALRIASALIGQALEH